MDALKTSALKMKHEIVGAGRIRFHIQIVNQSRFADEYSQKCVARAANPHHWLKTLRIHDFRVVDGSERFGIEFVAQDGLQMQRVATSTLHFFLRGL